MHEETIKAYADAEALNKKIINGEFGMLPLDKMVEVDVLFKKAAALRDKERDEQRGRQ